MNCKFKMSLSVKITLLPFDPKKMLMNHEMGTIFDVIKKIIFVLCLVITESTEFCCNCWCFSVAARFGIPIRVGKSLLKSNGLSLAHHFSTVILSLDFRWGLIAGQKLAEISALTLANTGAGSVNLYFWKEILV